MRIFREIIDRENINKEITVWQDFLLSQFAARLIVSGSPCWPPLMFFRCRTRCAPGNKAGLKLRRRQINPLRQHAVEIFREPRAVALHGVRQIMHRLLGEIGAEHRTDAVELHRNFRAPGASFIPVSSAAPASSSSHKRSCAESSCNAAMPAAMASGLPLKVPAWYTGPSGASNP